MVWFKVDDNLPNSRKVLSIPRARRAAAMGVWVLAGAWAAGELTDGKVPRFVLDEIASATRFKRDLIAAGLWREGEGGGIEFCNWDQFQRSKEDVEGERAGHARRQREYAERKKQASDASGDGSGDGSVTPALTVLLTGARPDPTRPVLPTEVPKETAGPQKSRATRLPDDFEVTPGMRDWARKKTPGVNIDRATEQFRNYWASKPGKDAVKLNWELTWRNWLLKDSDRVAVNGHAQGPRKSPGWVIN